MAVHIDARFWCNLYSGHALGVRWYVWDEAMKTVVACGRADDTDTARLGADAARRLLSIQTLEVGG